MIMISRLVTYFTFIQILTFMDSFFVLVPVPTVDKAKFESYNLLTVVLEITEDFGRILP